MMRDVNRCVGRWYNPTVRMSTQEQNTIQIKLSILQEKGWMLAALADGLEQKVNTLEKWKADQQNPANEKAVLEMLERIEKRKRIPKKRRYAKGSRTKEAVSGDKSPSAQSEENAAT